MDFQISQARLIIRSFLWVWILLALVIQLSARDNTSLRKAEIKVGYVINPRLEKMPDEDFSKMSAQVKKLSMERLDLELVIRKVKAFPISGLIDPYRELILKEKKVREHRLKPDEFSTWDLYAGLKKTFAKLPDKEIIAAVRNQANAAEIDLSGNRDDIILQIAMLHIRKMKEIQAITVPSDKGSLIRDDLRNEFMAWDFVNERQTDYDLIFTNQLIAGIETYLPDIHTSMRGGINSGFAGRSRGTYGGTVIMTTFPYHNRAAFFTKARGQDYSRDQVIETIAYTTVHELAHLFKYRKHYYDHPGCVMRPPPGLHYLEWINELKKNGRCRKIHEPMPFFKLYYSN